eukprot:TRINITY_DN112940_c0_g1_i1.p1 TRINITY_DN112940_c0_g1~~TRINITY_DN112940_c0_g1_i1.p1  ORF type:complete len:834 (+),score=169.36 TRINITY_DN112940_c0_g1_i1:126-2627(+)
MVSSYKRTTAKAANRYYHKPGKGGAATRADKASEGAAWATATPEQVLEAERLITPDAIAAGVTSLYNDEIKPFGRILRKRLTERILPGVGADTVLGAALAEITLDRLRSICEELADADGDANFKVVPEDGGCWSVYLKDRDPPYVDVYSQVDEYSEGMWRALAEFFRSGEGMSMNLPGGRYACAEALVDMNLAFLGGLSLGQVCHVVQLAITHRKVLGYLQGSVVSYARSQSRVKDDCAADKQPCANRSQQSYLQVATWESAKSCLREMLRTSNGEVPMSNVKRLFRSKFQVELSETSLGYTRLFELLQDERFHSVCEVRLQGNGYMVVQPDSSMSNSTASSTKEVVPRFERQRRGSDATEAPSSILGDYEQVASTTGDSPAISICDDVDSMQTEPTPTATPKAHPCSWAMSNGAVPSGGGSLRSRLQAKGMQYLTTPGALRPVGGLLPQPPTQPQQERPSSTQGSKQGGAAATASKEPVWLSTSQPAAPSWGLPGAEVQGFGKQGKWSSTSATNARPQRAAQPQAGCNSYAEFEAEEAQPQSLQLHMHLSFHQNPWETPGAAPCVQSTLPPAAHVPRAEDTWGGLSPWLSTCPSSSFSAPIYNTPPFLSTQSVPASVHSPVTPCWPVTQAGWDSSAPAAGASSKDFTPAAGAAASVSIPIYSSSPMVGGTTPCAALPFLAPAMSEEVFQLEPTAEEDEAEEEARQAEVSDGEDESTPQEIRGIKCVVKNTFIQVAAPRPRQGSPRRARSLPKDHGSPRRRKRNSTLHELDEIFEFEEDETNSLPEEGNGSKATSGVHPSQEACTTPATRTPPGSDCESVDPVQPQSLCQQRS